jgi:hypothetical protein
MLSLLNVYIFFFLGSLDGCSLCSLYKNCNVGFIPFNITFIKLLVFPSFQM